MGNAKMKNEINLVREQNFKTFIQIYIRIFSLPILFTFLMLCSNRGLGQTTVFYDDWDRTDANILAGGTPAATFPMSYTKSGTGATTTTNTSTCLKFQSATSNSLTYIYGPTSSFLSPYNTTLSSMTNSTVTWTFNLRYNRNGFNPQLPGTATSLCGQAIVLGSTTNNFATGNGYAIVYGNDAATNGPIRLVYFTGGCVKGKFTDIINTGVSDLAGYSNYASVRVTYNSDGNRWSLYVRDDGAASWSDPASGVTNQKGSTTVNSTYTGVSLPYFGFEWSANLSTGANYTGMVDKFKVTVQPNCTGSIVPPTEGAHTIEATQIVWRWNTVADATGYKWSATNDFSTATGMGTATSKTETGLTCGITYTRYIWSYNSCDTSDVNILTGSTLCPPANDVCANAINLPCGTTNLAGTTISSVWETAPSFEGCVGANGVWYTFTGDGDTTQISITTTTLDFGLYLATGTCATRTQIICDDLVSGPGRESFTFISTNGTVYYIYVANTFDGTTGNFTISRGCGDMGPANHYCVNAVNIVNSDVISGTNFYTHKNGPYSDDPSVAEFGGLSCNNTVDDVVFYKFTTGPAGGNYTAFFSDIDCIMGIAIQAAFFQTNTPCVCGSWNTNLNCISTESAMDFSLTANSLLPNTTYYLLVDGLAGSYCNWNLQLTGDVTLPIDLLFFDATCNHNGVEMKWATATEQNNSHFLLQRSIDAVHFETIANIKGSGSTNSTINYSYTDKTPYAGSSYYRLKQVDFDGISKNFTPVSVRCDDNMGEPNIRIFPNPFNTDLTIEFNNVFKKNAKITLFDLLGNIIMERQLGDTDISSGKYTLDVSELKSGMYLIRFTSESYSTTTKTFKKNN